MKRRVFPMSLLAVAFVLAACGGGKSNGNAARSAASPSAVPSMNCNGESPVWALRSPKVYLEPGDRLYGKTKRGLYICRSEAQAQGYQPARRPFGHHRHHRRDQE
jgi:predicted small secreted protein